MDWPTELSSGRGLQFFTDQNEDAGTFLITVEATGPEGVTESVSFNLIVEPFCDDQIISAPRVVGKQYIFLESGSSYEVPEFSNDKPTYCELTYSLQYDESQTWITKISEREIWWYASELHTPGDYLITVTGTGPSGVSAETSYILTAEISCSLQTI